MTNPDRARRECLAMLASLILSPSAAAAEPAGRIRRVAVLIFGSENNRASQAQAASLREGLKEHGWADGSSIRIDFRFEEDPTHIAASAEQIVAAAPDAIVVNTNAAAKALAAATRTIPIVFAGVGDPVANGLVATLVNPGGNITGITNLFFSVGGKWLELLKEIEPEVATVAVVSNLALSNRDDWFDAIALAAPKLGMNAIKVPVMGAADIGREVAAFSARPNAALALVPPGLFGVERELILRLAKENRLPTIFASRAYSFEGGLMSYGPDSADLFRQSAAYVDRILRGAKPGDLPVQFPTKFELVINRRTAQAIGLDVPITLLARADELIE